jgi:hypothetical protein
VTQDKGPDDPAQQRSHAPPAEADSKARERAVASMVSASLFAVAGTLIFAWALRAPDYPWLFAVGALPWVVGIVLFARALWRYTRL